MAIAWQTIENAIQAWLSAATGLACIVAEQNAPQPAVPYCTFRIEGPTREYADDELQSVTNLGNSVGQEIEQTAIRRRQITVHVQAFSNLQVEAGAQLPARDYLDMADAQLSLPSVHDALVAGGLTPIDETRAILNVSTVVESGWQSRAAFDVRFRLVDSVVEKTGYVDGIIYNPQPTYS